MALKTLAVLWVADEQLAIVQSHRMVVLGVPVDCHARCLSFARLAGKRYWGAERYRSASWRGDCSQTGISCKLLGGKMIERENEDHDNLIIADWIYLFLYFFAQYVKRFMHTREV